MVTYAVYCLGISIVVREGRCSIVSIYYVRSTEIYLATTRPWMSTDAATSRYA